MQQAQKTCRGAGEEAGVCLQTSTASWPSSCRRGAARPLECLRRSQATSLRSLSASSFAFAEAVRQSCMMQRKSCRTQRATARGGQKPWLILPWQQERQSSVLEGAQTVGAGGWRAERPLSPCAYKLDPPPPPFLPRSGSGSASPALPCPLASSGAGSHGQSPADCPSAAR